MVQDSVKNNILTYCGIPQKTVDKIREIFFIHRILVWDDVSQNIVVIHNSITVIPNSFRELCLECLT